MAEMSQDFTLQSSLACPFWPLSLDVKFIEGKAPALPLQSLSTTHVGEAHFSECATTEHI